MSRIVIVILLYHRHKPMNLFAYYFYKEISYNVYSKLLKNICLLIRISWLIEIGMFEMKVFNVLNILAYLWRSEFMKKYYVHCIGNR
jgi:hypothetical protein